SRRAPHEGGAADRRRQDLRRLSQPRRRHLTPVLEALQASGPAAFLRGSFYLYPLLNALHIFSIGALVTSALLMDLRVLGLGGALPTESVLRQLRPVALTALAAAAASGLLLFSV